MKRDTGLCVVAGLCAIVLGVAVLPLAGLRADPPAAGKKAEKKAAGKSVAAKADPEDVERARKTVQMLDHIYKQAIVLITDKYVHDEDDFPAGSAAVVWFKNISKQGSHHVRLVDASGEPIQEANVAQGPFETQGIKKLKEGADYVDQVFKEDGKLKLRALTPVPVVMKKCVMCHPNYEDVPKGEPIGAISYTIPLE